MDSEIIFMVEEAAEDGYTAKAVGESIFTEAETLQELRNNVKDAVAVHFENGKKQAIIRLHFVKDEILSA